jgi:hypothetical protein
LENPTPWIQAKEKKEEGGRLRAPIPASLEKWMRESKEEGDQDAASLATASMAIAETAAP